MANKTYAPLPFSYLTGGSASETSPTYGVKTSVSHEDAVNAVRPDGSTTDNDPYSIYAGRANQPAAHPPLNNRVSMDIIDPKLDVTDPYLLSTGRYSGSSAQDGVITEDPRYRNTVPSESDGGNVFFRSSDTPDNVFPVASPQPQDHQRPRLPTEAEFYPAPSLQRTGAYTNPTVEKITQDEESSSQTGAKKLPRYKVGTDSVYQYYAGNGGPAGQGQGQGQGKGQGEGRGPSPVPPGAKGMDNVNNPIWDKYYAGGSPPFPTSPGAPGVRPTTKEDDFNTLLRTSDGSGSYNNGCCGSKTCAVMTAIIITAIICLGAGFAAGWYVHPMVNPETGSDVTTRLPTSAPSAALTSSSVPLSGTVAPPVPSLQTGGVETTTPTTSTTISTTPTTIATRSTSTGSSDATSDPSSTTT